MCKIKLVKTRRGGDNGFFGQKRSEAIRSAKNRGKGRYSIHFEEVRDLKSVKTASRSGFEAAEKRLRNSSSSAEMSKP